MMRSQFLEQKFNSSSYVRNNWYNMIYSLKLYLFLRITGTGDNYQCMPVLPKPMKA